MTFDVSAPTLSAAEVPAAWRQAVQAQLHPQENVVACLEVDLDAQLHFVPSLLVATNLGLRSLSSGAEPAQLWPYRADLRLSHHDHAGVGHLVALHLLHDGTRRLVVRGQQIEVAGQMGFDLALSLYDKT